MVLYNQSKKEKRQTRQLIEGKYIDGKQTSKKSGASQGSPGAPDKNAALVGGTTQDIGSNQKKRVKY